MKVKIKETYVKCDICGQKIKKRGYYLPGVIYQMKVKTIDEDGIGLHHTIDMCRDCFNEFSKLVCEKLKEAKEKE